MESILGYEAVGVNMAFGLFRCVRCGLLSGMKDIIKTLLHQSTKWNVTRVLKWILKFIYVYIYIYIQELFERINKMDIGQVFKG